LDEIYLEGNHDFLYISHLYDQNKHSYNRMKKEYNVKGTPTVWFDGGDEAVLGGDPGNKQAYINAINACEARNVHDLDLDVNIRWLGNATMDIHVTLRNMDPSSQNYEGHLRVFVTEVSSTLGWVDTTGKPYQFAFLDFSFNESVTIAPSGTWQKSEVWNGNLHNSGYGVSYGSITPGNVAVFAVVYNDEWHQGYSYPPSGNPFDAYYVDEAEMALPDTLWGDASTIPETGGTVNLNLSADGSNGGRNYLLFGGVSGSTPGTPLPGGRVTLPVNWDLFTNMVISLANSSVFSDFMGTLDSKGMASATLNLPAVPGTAGIVMTFSYALNGPWDFVSNPFEVEIVP
jgi:hypothetical protein